MGTRVDSEEGSFKNANGKTIFTKYWRPSDQKLRALVFIAHGFGEHCSRYERLGTSLAEQGYLVFTQDHIGHGQSEGERVQVSDIAHYGGTIAIMSVMERPNFFTGAVFSSPSVQADPKQATRCMTCLGKIAAWFAPSYQVIPPIDPSLLSRDPVQVEKYANDPLVWHGGLKAKLIVALLDTMDDIQKNVSKVTAPFLLIHGDDDQVVPIEGSHFLHEHSPSTDKTFKVFENGRHEILNESEEMANEAHKDILDWIQRKLP